MKKGIVIKIFRLLQRRLRLILAIFLLFAIIALADFLFSTKLYRTTAAFSVEPQESGIIPLLKFLKSPVLAEKVASRVGIDDTDKLLSMVKVGITGGGENVIILSVTGENPKKITSIANHWVTELVMASRNPKFAQEIAVSGIRIVDKAHFPKRPLQGRPKILLILGLFLGVGTCFFLEYLDHTLRTGGGVERYASMPFMGEIPPALKEDASGNVINMLTHLKPDTLMAEAFRNVKASLLFNSPADNPLQTIMVTSSVLEEGKTFVASNLAIAFARTNEPTLLIDADMGKGKLKDSFAIETDKGLSSFLSGASSLEESIASTVIPNLYLLSAGAHVANSTDLLTTGKLDDLLQNVRSKFKRIIIDIPAVLDFDDVLPWAEKCDGLVCVIGSGFTPLEDVRAARKKLEKKTKVMGAVLNNIALKNDFYYYYRYLHFYLQNKLWQIKRQKEGPTPLERGL